MRGLVLLAAVLTSCAPTTYREFCNEDAAAFCTNAFKCDRERSEKSWVNRQRCVDDLSNAGACRNAGAQTCYLDPAVTGACLEALKALSCEARTTRPEACAAVNCEDSGTIRCETAGTSVVTGGCLRTRSACSDGRAYTITCEGQTCTCRSDGREGLDFERGTFCEDGPDMQDAAFVSRCMYNL